MALKAEYGNLETTAELVLGVVSTPMSLSITNGEEQLVLVTASGMQSFSGKTIIVTYDPTLLSLQNIAQ